MRIELESSKNNISNGILMLIILPVAGILISGLKYYYTEDILFILLGIGCVILIWLLIKWYNKTIVTKGKNRIEFNQKYLFLVNGEHERRIDLKNVRLNRPTVQFGNGNHWIILFKNESGEEENRSLKLLSTNQEIEVFRKRLNLIQEAKESSGKKMKRRK